MSDPTAAPDPRRGVVAEQLANDVGNVWSRLNESSKARFLKRADRILALLEPQEVTTEPISGDGGSERIEAVALLPRWNRDTASYGPDPDGEYLIRDDVLRLLGYRCEECGALWGDCNCEEVPTPIFAATVLSRLMPRPASPGGSAPPHPNDERALAYPHFVGGSAERVGEPEPRTINPPHREPPAYWSEQWQCYRCSECHQTIIGPNACKGGRECAAAIRTEADTPGTAAL